jgi:hypothetical protein
MKITGIPGWSKGFVNAVIGGNPTLPLKKTARMTQHARW